MFFTKDKRRLTAVAPKNEGSFNEIILSSCNKMKALGSR